MEFSAFDLTLIGGILAIVGGVIGAALTAYLQPRITQKLENKPRLKISLERSKIVFPKKIGSILENLPTPKFSENSKDANKNIIENLPQIFRLLSNKITYYSISITNSRNKFARNVSIRMTLGSYYIDPESTDPIGIIIDDKTDRYSRKLLANFGDIQPGHSMSIDIWGDGLTADHIWYDRSDLFPRMDDQGPIEFVWTSHGERETGIYNPAKKNIQYTTTPSAYIKSRIRNFLLIK